MNGLVRFAGRPNLVSAPVPTHPVFTLLPVTVGIATDLQGLVTEVPYGFGARESHSECMVLPVTVGIATDPHGHVKGHICCRYTWKSQ